MLMLTACSDWLDVNVDPNNPSDQIADYSRRLAHIEFHTNHAYFIGSQATICICGDMTNRTGNYRKFGEWEMNEARSTTCYQWWYVGAAANLRQTIETAEAAGAWHYAGAAYLIQAYGFALMNDLHGELPYSDALGENTMPKYDTGKEMFVHTIADIDKAIEYLSKPQAEGAVPLSANDFWANGDVNKWIKFAYLLKARQLNHLNKKGAGKWDPENGSYKYDADLILDCLSKGPQTVEDGMVIYHTEGITPNDDNFGWYEPTDWSPLHSVIATNSGYFYTKRLVDNLTSFAGATIEDPRADRVLPWARSLKTDKSPANLKWSADGKWRRSLGIDTHVPHSAIYDYATWGDSEKAMGGLVGYKHFYIDLGDDADYTDPANIAKANDTVYVQLKADSKGRAGGGKTMIYYQDGSKGAGDERSSLSGNFYIRASSPSFVGTYHEACFIKAEVLFNKGDKAGAFQAYQNGIRAHMELMNVKLNQWADDAVAGCPSFVPMSAAEISDYLANGIGTASNLTLGKIMTQKEIAMMHSVEIWNDMRRYDFDSNIFLNFQRAANWATNATAQNAVPDGKFPRRLRVSSHEYNYNTENLKAIGSQVPGANTGYDGGWFKALDMWTIPVWWDSDQE